MHPNPSGSPRSALKKILNKKGRSYFDERREGKRNLRRTPWNRDFGEPHELLLEARPFCRCLKHIISTGLLAWGDQREIPR